MRAGPDGSYALSDLGDGTYLLTVSAPGYASRSQEVTLTPGLVTPVEVQLQPLPGHLTGTVTNSASGVPVADATVVLGAWPVQTDAGGRYTLDNLTPGAYTFQVSIAGYEPYQVSVTVEPGRSRTIDVPLTPLAGALLAVQVVDVATGSPIAGATISYGALGDPGAPTDTGDGDGRPCADVALLVPLKRSAEFAAIRKRVADHHHLDAWEEDGLHFFVFQLHPTGSAAGTDGAGPDAPVAAAPLAVFAMQPGLPTPHSAVVVTPGADGVEAEAEIMNLRAADQTDTAPRA